MNFSCGENAEFQGIVVGYHFLLRPKFLNDTTVTQQETTDCLNLKYQEHNTMLSHCPYTTFANVLHNFAFEQESESIMRLKLKYIDLWHASKQSQSKLRLIAQELTKSNEYKHFTKLYICTKIRTGFQLVDCRAKMDKLDFVLLEYKDNTSNKYI